MQLKKLNNYYYSLLAVNLVSNCAIFFSLHGWTFILFTLFASFLLTLTEYVIGEILPSKVRSVYYWGLIAIYVLVIAVEVFVMIVFRHNISENLVFVLLDTNKGEIDAFFRAYTNPLSVLVFILSLVTLFLGVYWIGKGMARINGGKMFWPAAILAMLGVGTYAYVGYSFVKLDDGMHAMQFTTPTRIFAALAKVEHRKGRIRSLCEACRNVQALDESSDSINVVVVIGESFSRFHSSLYGYRLQTNPLLEKREQEGELIVFSNVVTRADATHEALRSIFSTDSLGLGFGSAPLFPAIFRAAGYRTYLWENQYRIGVGISFMVDDKLSSIMYDERNETIYSQDGPFLDSTIPDVSHFTKTLSVIHLMGQHFFYKDRYEDGFRIFTPADYDPSYTEAQREVLADYDNATLYNDAIVDRIIDRFDSTPTILFYFTDHGEELYENGDFSGHTNALRSKDLRYQILIPFMVWMSPSYRQANPEQYERICAAKNLPATTDDVSHFLMDVAQIHTETFSPYRSVVNPLYLRDKKRLILNSFDYDNWVRSK